MCGFYVYIVDVGLQFDIDFCFGLVINHYDFVEKMLFWEQLWEFM